MHLAYIVQGALCHICIRQYFAAYKSMEIIVGLLVSHKERQDKYKKIIQSILMKNLDTAQFLIYGSIRELHEDMILKYRRADLLIMQASTVNFEFAVKLREVDRHCLIIYPAMSMEYVLAAFESMPMAYIPSGNDGNKNSLAEAITRAAGYLRRVRSEFNYETKSKMLHYTLAEIDYFESQYRIVHIVKHNGNRETVSAKLDDIEKKRLLHFARCHQSFLVNMDHIQCIDKTTKMIYFYSGQSVPSSKKFFSDFISLYRKYKDGKEVNETNG